MDVPRGSFINNSRLIRISAPYGYTYVWRFEDELGLTLEMGMEEFSQYISDKLDKLRVKRNENFQLLISHAEQPR